MTFQVIMLRIFSSIFLRFANIPAINYYILEIYTLIKNKKLKIVAF